MPLFAKGDNFSRHDVASSTLDSTSGNLLYNNLKDFMQIPVRNEKTALSVCDQGGLDKLEHPGRLVPAPETPYADAQADLILRCSLSAQYDWSYKNDLMLRTYVDLIISVLEFTYLLWTLTYLPSVMFFSFFLSSDKRIVFHLQMLFF